MAVSSEMLVSSEYTGDFKEPPLREEYLLGRLAWGITLSYIPANYLYAPPPGVLERESSLFRYYNNIVPAVQLAAVVTTEIGLYGATVVATMNALQEGVIGTQEAFYMLVGAGLALRFVYAILRKNAPHGSH